MCDTERPDDGSRLAFFSHYNVSTSTKMRPNHFNEAKISWRGAALDSVRVGLWLNNYGSLGIYLNLTHANVHILHIR